MLSFTCSLAMLAPAARAAVGGSRGRRAQDDNEDSSASLINTHAHDNTRTQIRNSTVLARKHLRGGRTLAHSGTGSRLD